MRLLWALWGLIRDGWRFWKMLGDPNWIPFEEEDYVQETVND